MDDLASFEFGMTDFYSFEHLHLPNDTRDGLQTIKDQVDLSLIQLIMLSCGRRKLEAHKPVNVKVHQEMNDLRTQLARPASVFAHLMRLQSAVNDSFWSLAVQGTCPCSPR